jgi:hypothetical protein
MKQDDYRELTFAEMDEKYSTFYVIRKFTTIFHSHLLVVRYVQCAI